DQHDDVTIMFFVQNGDIGGPFSASSGDEIRRVLAIPAVYFYRHQQRTAFLLQSSDQVDAPLPWIRPIGIFRASADRARLLRANVQPGQSQELDDEGRLVTREVEDGFMECGQTHDGRGPFMQMGSG
ncbi:MAG: hypothetical protein ACRD0P_20295, partial [Stackebrandtia sp.]